MTPTDTPSSAGQSRVNDIFQWFGAKRFGVQLVLLVGLLAVVLVPPWIVYTAVTAGPSTISRTDAEARCRATAGSAFGPRTEAVIANCVKDMLGEPGVVPYDQIR